MNPEALNLSESTTQHDNAFRAIPGLQWLPWVGQHYSERPQGNRLMIVGESHYIQADTPVGLEQQRMDRSQPAHTRDVVSQCLVREQWSNPTLNAITKLLFLSEPIDSPRLWGSLVFMNIVQRLMDRSGSRQEQPNIDDFMHGWRVLADVVRLLQPSHCLCIGVAAANHFNHAMASSSVSFTPVSWVERVSRTWGRKATINMPETRTELIFVQHVGKYFSWRKWHSCLRRNHAEFFHVLDPEGYVLGPTYQRV